MIYNWNDPKSPYFVARHGRAFDANGLEIKLKVFEMDTETGRCEYYVTDENGNCAFNGMNEILKATSMEAAPIHIEWRK